MCFKWNSPLFMYMYVTMYVCYNVYCRYLEEGGEGREGGEGMEGRMEKRGGRGEGWGRNRLVRCHVDV